MPLDESEWREGLPWWWWMNPWLLLALQCRAYRSALNIVYDMTRSELVARGGAS